MKGEKFCVIAFMAIIVCLPIATFLMPKQTESVLENRQLQTPPELSADSIFSKEFMSDTEKYMTDHFLAREKLVTAKTMLELSQGKREVNGVFIGSDMLLEKVSEPPKSVTDENIDAINAFTAKYKASIDMSVMLIPSALELYHEKAPLFADNFDQQKYISDVYARLQNVSCIDAAAQLSNSSNEYIFYRTDHHWTSLGAYYGYRAAANTLGFRAATLDSFNVEHAAYDFLGTLFSKVLVGEKMADIVDIYTYEKGELVTEVIKYNPKTGEPQSHPSIFFRDYLDKKDKYSVFLGENEPVVRIKTSINNGKKLIVFKDSFSHALMQFLPIHYEEIALVDLRYIKRPIEDYINIEEYSQALFAYNMAGFVDDTGIKKVTTY